MLENGETSRMYGAVMRAVILHKAKPDAGVTTGHPLFNGLLRAGATRRRGEMK